MHQKRQPVCSTRGAASASQKVRLPVERLLIKRIRLFAWGIPLFAQGCHTRTRVRGDIQNTEGQVGGSSTTASKKAVSHFELEKIRRQATMKLNQVPDIQSNKLQQQPGHTAGAHTQAAPSLARRKPMGG